MRPALLAIAILLLAGYVLPQERVFKLKLPTPDRFDFKTVKPEREHVSVNIMDKELIEPLETAERNHEIPFDPVLNTRFGFGFSDDKQIQKVEVREGKFDWKSAMIQSGIFLGIQHGFRMTEEKTRRELDGPFFKDWKESVQNLRGWDDGGKFFTNYIAHPMQGSITGRIFVNNSPKARYQTFGSSGDYWISRLKALAWSAVWSTQFEIGPISEASLGNVGQKTHANGDSKLTYVDLVVTPVAGTGFLIAEDMIDRFILKDWIERKIKNEVVVKILRSVFTPMTSFANLLRWRAPWRRDFRFN